MDLFFKIRELAKINTLSKHEQLVGGIIAAIDCKIIQKGDQLPSINQMSEKLGYARKTIVKAYEELKGRGIVESKNFVGYFISSEETSQTLKVALLLYAFHGFQEALYNSFRDNLQGNVHLDVYFHHNNIDIFETIFNNITQKYGMYVVAPIEDQRIKKLLQRIPSEKLLIIDRYLSIGDQYSFITQEFEQSTYDKLVELLPSIEKFKKFVLFFRDDADYPKGVLAGFERFASDFGINAEIHNRFAMGDTKKDTAYLFVSDTYLWELLKDCKNQGFEIGSDVGILAHDDHVSKELVFGGITTISADFQHIGKRAAEFVNDRKEIQKIVPTALIRRNSI